MRRKEPVDGNIGSMLVLQLATNKFARWKAPASGRGALLLRDMLREEIGDDAPLREMLLLEAARRGCLYIVRELLCPTPYYEGEKAGSERMATAKSPPPVSINVLDKEKNNALHLAVQSGNAALVRWLQRYCKTCFESSRRRLRYSSEWLSALNDKSETPLNLAIDRGCTRVLNLFLKLDQFLVLPGASLCRFSLPLAIQRMNRLDIAEEMSAFAQGSIDLLSLTRKVLLRIKESNLENEDTKFYISFLTFIEARHQAPRHVRDTLDRWMRYHHIKYIRMVTDEESLSLSKMKETLGGEFCPWWNAKESDFDLEHYIQNRGETEECSLFELLCSSVKAGHYDSAMWLLKTFKAPPSMRSCRSDSDNFDGLWYLNNADKIAEEALFGWVDSIVAEILESSGDTRSLYRPSSKIVERKVLPRRKEYDSIYSYSIFANQLPGKMVRFAPQQGSFVDFWDDVWRKMKGTSQNSNEEKMFGVETKVYVATMLAGRYPLESLERSGHGKLVSYFLETAYSEESGFTAADLPRLSCFVALDLLVFFQFLTKTRKTSNNGEEYSYLDLNIPLLFPPASELQLDAEDDEEMEVDEDDDECVICLERMTDPYALSCGHRFHQQCLFRYTFEEVREAEEEELDENSTPEERAELAHQVLAEHEDLSFILGFCTCPYCRAEVKPSIPRAFALNIADGLWRTASHRRYAPNSPNLDISECRPGTTVGEALLGFSACCGAINIFEWLVKVKKIDPESFKARDGINILYVALSHGQLLIVRWLCENGYSHLLLGGLDRDQFDDDSSFRDLNTVLSEQQAARIDFDEVEEDLSRRRDDFIEDYEYSEDEKAIMEGLQGGLTEEEESIANIRADVRRKSPIHMLLMSGKNNSLTSNCEEAFDYLWSTGKLKDVLPKGWCSLILTCSTNGQLRKEAKRFLSYQIISRPKDLDAEALKLQVEKSADGLANGADFTKTSLKDVLECNPGDISPLDIEKNISSFNFWRMFASGIKDWKQFARIASSVSLFVTSSSIKLFDDDPYVREEIISFLEEVVIQGGCFNLLVSFCQMESFEHIFDLNSEADSNYSFYMAKSLKKMIKDQNKWDTFSLLFDTLENIDVAARKIAFASSTALKAVSQGKSLEELQEMTEEVRRLVSSIPNCERPFGRREEDFSRFADPAQWDWLSGRSEIDGEYKDYISILLDRQDATVMNWALSFLLKQWKFEGSYDETLVVLQYIEAVTTCSSENLQFGLETIITHLTEVDRSSKYFGNCDELLMDLLGIGSQEKEEEDFSKVSFDDCNDAFSRNRLREGLLMQIMSGIFGKCRYFTVGSQKLKELVKTDPREVVETLRERIETKYRAIEWFLSRPDIRELLMAQENLNLCSKHLLSSKDLADISVAPHLTFRIMNLFFSRGLDPTVEIIQDDRAFNLVEYVLDQHDYMHESGELSEVMKIWAQDDEYKTASGQAVDSAQAFVRWLVNEIGIDIQHIHFNDIKHDDFFHDRNVFSLEEWDALRREQRKKKFVTPAV